MYNELTKYQKISELLEDEFANWTYEGAACLIEMQEELEEDQGELIEFDRRGLRREFTEYSSIEEAAADYNIPEDVDALDCINNQTWVNEFKTATGGTGLILRQF